MLRMKLFLEKLFKARAKSSSDDLGDALVSDRTHSEAQGKQSFAGYVSSRLFTGKSLAGGIYFPPELIGGGCPRVPGQEREIVWNAAAEACDSERVHVVWQATEDKIWYLATRAADLASHPNTWCPFASLLPTSETLDDGPVCYTYYADEAATMMTIMGGALNVHRGTSSVIRAKAERFARDVAGMHLVDLTPEAMASLTAVPWYSVSLFEDRVRRVLAVLSVVSALTITVIAFLIWIGASLSLLSSHRDLTSIQERTEQKSIDLMAEVQKLRISPLRDQMAKFAELNDSLLQIGGWMKVYEIKAGRLRWKAVVPSSVTGDFINELGGRMIETTSQGVVIGNEVQLVEIAKEKKGKGRKQK